MTTSVQEPYSTDAPVRWAAESDVLLNSPTQDSLKPDNVKQNGSSSPESKVTANRESQIEALSTESLIKEALRKVNLQINEFKHALYDAENHRDDLQRQLDNESIFGIIKGLKHHEAILVHDSLMFEPGFRSYNDLREISSEIDFRDPNALAGKDGILILGVSVMLNVRSKSKHGTNYREDEIDFVLDKENGSAILLSDILDANLPSHLQDIQVNIIIPSKLGAEDFLDDIGKVEITDYSTSGRVSGKVDVPAYLIIRLLP